MADTDKLTDISDASVVEEPVVGAVTPDPVAQTRRSGVLPAVFGGAVAAALGFGVAQVVPDGWPLPSGTAFEQAIADQFAALTAAETQIADLKQALALIEARPATDPSFAARIARLESAPAPVDENLSTRLTAVEENIAALAAQPASGSVASAAAITALQTAVAALQNGGPGNGASGQTATATAAAAETEARLAAVEARASQTLAQATLGQIALAVDAGGAFDALLSGLDPADVPPILKDHAATGLPTLADLQSSFPSAASAAIDASLRADMGDGWADRMTNFLRTQTGARSLTPRDGDDPDAILSRAEAALGRGDTQATLALIDTLPPAGRAAFDTWATMAALQRDAQQALVALRTTLGVQK
jgi:hypothetical protein